MSQQPHDERFILRALTLATESIGLASPNPQVGCVLVKDEQIIGEGAHRYAFLDHAEIIALKQATQRGLSPEGATAYVTLEPCSHQGRTGPCADALVRSGIARCVIATQDPNPQVAGKGIAKLRAAGIEVTTGVLQQQSRDLNDAFAKFIQTGTPFVTLKAALSVDGKLAPPPHLRKPNEPHWLTGPAARSQAQRLRHAADAILAGIGTVLADDPLLTDRSGLPRRLPLLRVVLDGQLRTPLTSKLVTTANHDLLILCDPTAPEENRAALEQCGVEVVSIEIEDGHLSLTAALKLLAQRKVLSVLVEAGSQLNGAFLTQQLVDKAVLFYAETELGDEALPFATGIPSPFLFEQSLTRITRAAYGTDAVLTGYLRDPWPRQNL
jgi:diaminohydroxyphosphoribosylaminopyrimidine deaminase / 5-amino-6-(5-phosphoribosylamino)uracil reductase